MSFLINPFLQYDIVSPPTQIGASLNRSVGNPGNPVSFTITQTLNAFRVFVLHWEFTSEITLTSCTIGGVNVPIIIQRNVVQGAAGCGIAFLSNRWGAASGSQTITFTFSANPTAVGLGAYTLFRNTNDTPYYVQTQTKETSSTAIDLTIPVLPRSLNIIACTNLIDGTTTISNTAPPTLVSAYNLACPVSSPQFRMVSSGINNGSSTVDYSGEVVTVTSSLASCVYATISYV